MLAVLRRLGLPLPPPLLGVGALGGDESRLPGLGELLQDLFSVGSDTSAKETSEEGGRDKELSGENDQGNSAEGQRGSSSSSSGNSNISFGDWGAESNFMNGAWEGSVVDVFSSVSADTFRGLLPAPPDLGTLLQHFGLPAPPELPSFVPAHELRALQGMSRTQQAQQRLTLNGGPASAVLRALQALQNAPDVKKLAGTLGCEGNDNWRNNNINVVGSVLGGGGNEEGQDGGGEAGSRGVLSQLPGLCTCPCT